ncbi:flagellar hook protein FlgE [Roseibium aquae]|uniref:Flagellar hook protein FlgE n=1 Tax=Roseibium aquae TaxID=1323746 RepID=A0A916TNM4_9HYPH|nr:flagellar hook protein FlgE [Roseibium aquae]GGB53876.1 flagellar hook protein FlgE [Roseibium aquae]
MSLFGVMRTGVSGMNAQASKLGTVADNIANASTTGYKKAQTEFQSLVVNSGGGSYSSGGVEAKTLYNISQQGTLSFTTSGLDLAIDGNGFFVVEGQDGQPVLTRAGKFVKTNNGELINTAGYYLQGLPVTDGNVPAPAANGLGGMERVNVSQNQLEATETTQATLWANVREDAAIPATLPSANVAASAFSAKTSLVVYDNLGNEVTLDIYYTKTADTATDSTWEVSVFDASTASAGATPFPYGAGPLVTSPLTFSRTDGSLTAGGPISIPVPNGATIPLDVSNSTMLAEDFTITEVDTNGNAPASVEDVAFGDDGTLFALYSNGDRRAIYKIPLADVAAPDKLLPVSGNVFRVTNESGDLQVGFPGEAGLGDLTVGALEGSNADIGTELTAMIESQRSYSANSKSFKAGSDLLQELVNLVR